MGWWVHGFERAKSSVAAFEVVSNEFSPSGWTLKWFKDLSPSGLVLKVFLWWF